MAFDVSMIMAQVRVCHLRDDRWSETRLAGFSMKVAVSMCWSLLTARPGNSRSRGGVFLAVTLRRVSYDLFFWPVGATDEPCPLADRLADEEADGPGGR